jgi:hypothetical protein
MRKRSFFTPGTVATYVPAAARLCVRNVVSDPTEVITADHTPPPVRRREFAAANRRMISRRSFAVWGQILFDANSPNSCTHASHEHFF